MKEETKEWAVQFGFEDDESVDFDLLSAITSYKDMWISSIEMIGDSIRITVESASGHAEYDIRSISERYSWYVCTKPFEVIY